MSLISARRGLVRVGMDLTELPVVGKAVWVCVVGLVALAFVGFA